MYKRATALVTAVSLVLVGCASSSKNVAASYVSPLQFQNYDCAQLAAESQRIQGRVTELGGRLDNAATKDAVVMGVALIVFWPAIFALSGNKVQEAEYARLKGEFEGVQKAGIDKKCPGFVAVASASPATPAPVTSEGASVSSSSQQAPSSSSAQPDKVEKK